MSPYGLHARDLVLFLAYGGGHELWLATQQHALIDEIKMALS